MRKAFPLVTVLSILLAACSGTSVPTAPATLSDTQEEHAMRTIVLVPTEIHQTIAGFGASGCWWAQDVGGWEGDKVDAIVRMLFDRSRGIGLNIYRFEVGAGPVNNSTDPWRRAETFETAPGQYDWGRDANAVNILKKAVAAGADDVMLFANSPTARMTVSGKTTGEDSGGPNLKPGMEGDFARYLTDIALHFIGEGVPVKYISPVNEPQWEWKEKNGQEGCHYEPQQVVKVAEALVKELARRCPEVRPSLADSGKWLDDTYTIDLCKDLFHNSIVGPAMDHFALHSYWSAMEGKRQVVDELKAAGVTLPLWQTEWCQMEGGRDLGMGSALVLAETVHDDLSVGNCAAWIDWIAVSCYDFKDGLVYVDLDDRQVFDSKRLWALGNYSRFVREGCRRIGTSGDTGSLLVSAFLSPDGKTATLVVINPSTAAETLDLQAQGFSSYTAYETSAARSLEPVASGTTGKYSFPAESVTTLVLIK